MGVTTRKRMANVLYRLTVREEKLLYPYFFILISL